MLRTPLTLLLGFCLACIATAEEVVIDDDGRLIQLNEDGTWLMLSRDSFATTEAGERIRLRPDGTWSYAAVDEAPAAVARAVPDSDVSLYLAHVEIERKILRRQKGRHAETKTFFTLRVINDSSAPVPISDSLVTQLTVRSSRGGIYEIESVSSTTDSIRPGEQADLIAVASGSPQWFGIKYLSVEVPAGTFGDAPARVLRKDMDEVVRTDVDSFSAD